MTITEQTRSDLEATLAAATDHWDEGPGGCCIQMCFGAAEFGYENRWEHTPGFSNRICDLAEALGFGTPFEMYHWNDAHGRTKDDILHRLKDALNGEFQ